MALSGLSTLQTCGLIQRRNTAGPQGVAQNTPAIVNAQPSLSDPRHYAAVFAVVKAANATAAALPATAVLAASSGAEALLNKYGY